MHASHSIAVYDIPIFCEYEPVKFSVTTAMGELLFSSVQLRLRSDLSLSQLLLNELSYHTRHSATRSLDTMIRPTQVKSSCQHVKQLNSSEVLLSTRKATQLK